MSQVYLVFGIWYLRECDIEGVGVDVCGSKLASGHFADDGVGIATTVTGMHHLLRRLEGYMDDARRKFNVENKATVIMCFNVAKKELVSLNSKYQIMVNTNTKYTW